MTTRVAIAVAFLLLAVFCCCLELAGLLAHRLRLMVYAKSGRTRTRVLDWLLEESGTASMAAGLGAHVAVAGVAATTWTIADGFGWAATECAMVAVGVALLLFVLVELVPRTIVPHRPTRVLVFFAYPYLALTWILYPLARLLTVLRRLSAGSSAGGNASALGTPPSFLLREDLRRLISRPELAILGERETEMALQLFRFQTTLVRDLMTPLARVIAVPESATVEDVFRTVREAGFTRIPVFRGETHRLVGLVNVQGMLHADPARSIDSFVRTAPSVEPLSPAQSLFANLRRNPDWMAFVEENGRCVGIVTVEDLVEEILGEIIDEFEMPRPRYVPAGRHRLRANARLELREIGRDLDLGREDLPPEPVAAAIRAAIGRAPQVGERVEIHGLPVYVTRVEDGEAAEIEIPRARR